MLRIRIRVPRPVRRARRMLRGVGMKGIGRMLVRRVVVTERESVRRECGW